MTTISEYKKLSYWIVVIVTIIAAGYRLIGISEWPYRFHETVQYESAMAARKIWWSIEPSRCDPNCKPWLDSVGTKHITSPPIFPGLVAVTYSALGREAPWVSELYGSLFWIAAGWFVFFASWRLTGQPLASAVGFAWFNCCSYGVMVSRSFQTEPLLALGFAFYIWYLARTDRQWSWLGVVQCGLLGGLVVFLKPGVLSFPIFVAVCVAILRCDISPNIRTKVAKCGMFAVLMMLPSLIYAYVMLSAHLRAKVVPELLITPTFYSGLALQVRTSVGFAAVLLGLTGVAAAAREKQYLPLCLAVGYVMYLTVFTFHTSTHSYYHVPLMVIIAVSLACGAALALRFLARQWPRPTPAVVAVGAIGILAVFLFLQRHYYVGPWQWSAASVAIREHDLVQQTLEIQRYRAIRNSIPPGAQVVALTEFYGYPLEYYTCLQVNNWPSAEDRGVLARTVPLWDGSLSDAEVINHLIATGHTHFVITDIPLFQKSPELVTALQTLGKPVPAGNGVLVYSLVSLKRMP